MYHNNLAVKFHEDFPSPPLFQYLASSIDGVFKYFEECKDKLTYILPSTPLTENDTKHTTPKMKRESSSDKPFPTVTPSSTEMGYCEGCNVPGPIGLHCVYCKNSGLIYTSSGTKYPISPDEPNKKKKLNSFA